MEVLRNSGIVNDCKRFLSKNYYIQYSNRKWEIRRNSRIFWVSLNNFNVWFNRKLLSFSFYLEYNFLVSCNNQPFVSQLWSKSKSKSG